MYRRNEADHETYTAEHGQKEEGKREYGEGWKITPRQNNQEVDGNRYRDAVSTD